VESLRESTLLKSPNRIEKEMERSGTPRGKPEGTCGTENVAGRGPESER